MGFFLLFLIPWSFYSCFMIYKKKEKRKLRVAKLAIWGLGIIAINATHNHYSVTTRNIASKTIDSITQYKKKHNKYPENLELMGISSTEYEDKYSIRYFFTKDNKPEFHYTASFSMMNYYHYDFEEGNWKYFED